MDMSFYNGKRVLITGHTGFKGSWMSQILINSGAILTGYALESPTNPSLFSMTNLKDKMFSIIGDIRNLNKLKDVFEQCKPEIVIHMAAQPIVRDSYKNPVYTYETNVMGTVNILECIRLNDCVKSFVNVTTDKVYKNNEWYWGYRENDALDGFDPYSNSKSCAELVTHSYKDSFFKDRMTAISTVRAGNVIGGGDFANDRIIPDCIRAIEKKQKILVRNPNSIRPYQHVLEPIMAYLMIAQKQYQDVQYADNYNVGPNDSDCITTGDIVELFCKKWGQDAVWYTQADDGPHEANFLKLDCSKLKSKMNWQPRWSISEALDKVVEWTKVYLEHGDIVKIMDKQIEEYCIPRNRRIM